MQFSDLYNIACPSCQAKHSYSHITSLNDLGSEYYSDGYVSFFFISTTKKCSGCNYIILNCLDLKNLGEVESKTIYKTKTFWQKVWRTPADFTRESINEYPRLLYLELKDWIDTSKRTDLTASQKERYSLQAMWLFNQRTLLGQELNDNEITQLKKSEQDIKCIEDQFIEQAEHDFTDRLQLLAADIYRRRGEFTQALMCLNRVSSETNTFKVVCQRKWINEQSTKLEVFPSYYDRQNSHS